MLPAQRLVKRLLKQKRKSYLIDATSIAPYNCSASKQTEHHYLSYVRK